MMQKTPTGIMPHCIKAHLAVTAYQSHYCTSES